MWWRVGQQSPHVMFNGSDKIEIADALNVLSCIARFGRIQWIRKYRMNLLVRWRTAMRCRRHSCTPSHSLSPWTTWHCFFARGNGPIMPHYCQGGNLAGGLLINTPLIFRLGTTGCEPLVPQATKWGEIVCGNRQIARPSLCASSHSLRHTTSAIPEKRKKLAEGKLKVKGSVMVCSLRHLARH
jgi:hypothetical protein